MLSSSLTVLARGRQDRRRSTLTPSDSAQNRLPRPQLKISTVTRHTHRSTDLPLSLTTSRAQSPQ